MTLFALALVPVLAVALVAVLILQQRKRNADALTLGDDTGLVGDDWKQPVFAAVTYARRRWQRRLEQVTPEEVEKFWAETLKTETPLLPRSASDSARIRVNAIAWNRTRVRLQEYLVGKQVVKTDGQAVDMLARFPEQIVLEEKLPEEPKPEFNEEQMAKFFDVLTDRALEAVVQRASDRVAREVATRVYKQFVERIEERCKEILRNALAGQLKEQAEEIRKNDALGAMTGGHLSPVDEVTREPKLEEDLSLTVAQMSKEYSKLDGEALKRHYKAVLEAVSPFLREVRQDKYKEIGKGNLFKDGETLKKVVESPATGELVAINVTPQIRDKNMMLKSPTEKQYAEKAKADWTLTEELISNGQFGVLSAATEEQINPPLNPVTQEIVEYMRAKIEGRE